MKEFIKRIIKKNKDIYFTLYKFYMPIKKIKNRKKYNIHFNNFQNELINSKNKKIFHIGIPTHNNLGDQAQYYCIKKYLKATFKDYDIIEIIDDLIFLNYKNTIKIIKKYIKDNDIFAFQSGYRTTDVANFGGEYAHEKILNNFKNKVIVFPQTINFENKKEEEKSSLSYKKNSNYIFLARDDVSYNKARVLYDKKKVYLYPDIVTTLIGEKNLLKETKKDGILLILRNDAEKLYSNDDYTKLIEKLKSITKNIEITDTNSKENFEFNKNIVEEELKKKLEQISKYKLIITDRYHGTIFGLITNAFIIVLDSTDHKLSSGVKWFSDIYKENTVYVKDIKDAYTVAKKLYQKENFKNKNYFKKEYYDKLKEIVENEK